MTRRVFIVRHGNTFEAGEPVRRIGRATDLPLTDVGRAQAVALGEVFAADGLRFDTAWTGPLTRTRDTAALILARTGAASPEVAEWLAEIDHGHDEGRLETEVVARAGQVALDAWNADGAAPDGWRVDRDERLAAWRGFFALQALAGTGVTLLVTSNGAARFALLAAEVQQGALALRTGAFGELVVEGARLRLIRWDIRPTK